MQFTAQIDPTIRETILAELSRIEANHDVRLLFAVESGSRAWGFPSPDSDYDVRFVYAHKRDWYLSLTPGRDVIELPISGDLDINGWDIRKALNLLLKPNPVLLEWLSSPVRYLWDDTTCAALTELAQQVSHGTACRHHYLNLGEGQYRRHIADAGAVNYKKYFYCLRPALALRWVRMLPDRQPPMNLQALMAEIDLDQTVTARIADLLELKAKAKETGDGPRIPEIDTLIEAEFTLARQADPSAVPARHHDRATALFRQIIDR
ncbi:MAG: nucleotidyltransferase domain-containing protein [Pseudomonadota bacterium]